MTPREWNATSYDKVAAPMTARGIELVDDLALAGDETVLDAGCGTGQVTEYLLAHLPDGRVIALDGSEAMLRVADQRFGDDPRVSLVHADLAEPLPINEPVDAIISTSTFHWVRDHDALWHNLAAVLRPGGVLSTEFGGEGNIDSVLAMLPPNETWTFAGPADTLRRLDAAGFVDATAELVPRPAQIPPEDLEEYLRTVVLGSHVAALSAADADALVARVAAELPEPVIDYVRLVVRAVRAGRRSQTDA
jgi:trans-aconitate 2-methyltransferase